MTNEEIYDIWAPAGELWSPWVKPVLFACRIPAEDAPDTAVPGRTAAWAPPAAENAALVLDLPGPEGVAVGLALAALGYRPVPLYNAVPGPPGTLGRKASLVEVREIVSALRSAAPSLARLQLAREAPPAFLLDANRRGASVAAAPGDFDNRSVSFSTDFPSARFLDANGIRRCVLFQLEGEMPQPDLAHTLRAWQAGGVAIELARADGSESRTAIEVARPPRFGSLFQRALAAFGLRRYPLGGFGGTIPTPSQG